MHMLHRFYERNSITVDDGVYITIVIVFGDICCVVDDGFCSRKNDVLQVLLSVYAKICVQIQSSSNNVDLKCIPEELLAAAGVVGAVVIVQTVVEVDQSCKIGIFFVLVGGKKVCKKCLFVRARHLFLIH